MHQAVLVPHMLTSLSTYLDRLSAPDFSPGGVPLSSLMPITGERCQWDTLLLHLLWSGWAVAWLV
jgi:hypothetical protein